MFDLFGQSNIIVKVVDRKFLVSTNVFDRNGLLVAEIVDNEWKAATDSLSWDRNYSDDAFEIKDNRGDIVLQVRVLLDRVQLQGVWRNTDGTAFKLVSRGYHNDASMVIITPLSPPSLDAGSKIAPMFKYPSAHHLGEKVS